MPMAMRRQKMNWPSRSQRPRGLSKFSDGCSPRQYDRLVREPLVMRVLCTLAITFALGAAHGDRPCAQPRWTVDLVSTYHLSSFGTARRPAAWQRQRGMLFTSADTLVVYYVVENELTTLERRKANEGGGRFTLEAVFLDERDGHELRRLQWPTTASGQSEIYGTHGGGLLVRTGGMLYAYSSDLREVATRALPTNAANLHDYWFSVIVPPGNLLFLEHHWYNRPGGPAGDQKALVDAKTLRTIPNPSPGDVPFWPQADYLWHDLARHQSQPRTPTSLRELGELDRELKSEKLGNCVASAFVGIPQHTEEPSCKELELFHMDGSLWWQLKFHDEIGAIGINGNALAVVLEHWPWDPFDRGLPPRPVRINFYDTARRMKECSIDLEKIPSNENYDFAVSPNGAFAVRMGNKVSVF